jgi:hypothetical protein
VTLVSAVYRQVKVCANGRLLVQRSLTKCGVSECDHETSTMSRLRDHKCCRTIKNSYGNCEVWRCYGSDAIWS